MNINPIKLLSEQLEKLINEHGSSTILRERLESLRDDIQRLQQKNVALEAESAKIKEENTKLLKDLEKYRESEKFTQERGALWRINPDGTYSESPCCVRCKMPMSKLSLFPDIVKCTHCEYTPFFQFHEIKSILEKLNKQK